MKTILDRFDRSPLWIRLTTILILTGVLIGGLYTVRKNSAEQVTIVKQQTKKTGSLPVKKKDPKKEKEEKEEALLTAAEKAVSQFETTASQETLITAQAAVDKVKDETKKQAFQARIQYIVDYYGMQTTHTTQTTQTNQTTVQTEVPQYNETPQYNQSPQVQNGVDSTTTETPEQ